MLHDGASLGRGLPLKRRRDRGQGRGTSSSRYSRLPFFGPRNRAGYVVVAAYLVFPTPDSALGYPSQSRQSKTSIRVVDSTPTDEFARRGERTAAEHLEREHPTGNTAAQG